MNDPFRLHEAVRCLVLDREPRQRATGLADHDADLDLETVFGLPGVGTLLALEFLDI